MNVPSLTETFFRNADLYPDRTAIIDPDGSAASYSTLAALAMGVAGALVDLGVQPGETVLIRVSQTSAFTAVYLGIHAAGAAAAPLERTAPHAATAAMAASLGATLLIGDPSDLPLAASPLVPGLRVYSMAEILQKALSTPPRGLPALSPDAPSDILFTTGTTGLSKGVLHTQQSVALTGAHFAEHCGFHEDTVFVLPGPVNHAGNIWCLWATLHTGSTLFYLNGITDWKAFFAALERKPSGMACYLPPSAVRTILSLTGDALGKYRNNISFMQFMGAPLPDADREQLRTLLPYTALNNALGTSETGPVTMCDISLTADKPGCIGYPVPWLKVFLSNQDRTPAGAASPSSPGLLSCSGPTCMKGYVNAPEATAAAMDDSGTVYLSDLCWVDPDGCFRFVSRQGDVINVGGLKVSPSEVEEAALALPGVQDCVCVSMPHPLTGEALKLLVVPDSRTPFSPKTLAAGLRQTLDAYKVPTRYEAVSEIRKTYNGKIDRKFYRNPPSAN